MKFGKRLKLQIQETLPEWRDKFLSYKDLKKLVRLVSSGTSTLGKLHEPGGLLRLPFIQKVLQQPFFTTDLVSKLVKECENTIDAVFPDVQEEGRIKERGQKEASVVACQGIFRNTIAALVTMQEMRRGSSTYGQFSLPPLNLPDSELIQSFQPNSSIPILYFHEILHQDRKFLIPSSSQSNYWRC